MTASRVMQFAAVIPRTLADWPEPAHSREIRDAMVRDKTVVAQPSHREAMEACEFAAAEGWIVHVPGPAGGSWRLP